MKEEVGDKEGVTTLYNNIGHTYSQQKKYTLALEYCLKSLSLAKEIGSLVDLKEAEKVLSEIYEKQSNSKKALAHYKAYITANDSLLNEENTKKTVRSEMNFEFEKKEAAAKLEQEKKEAVATADKKRQSMVLILVCCVLLLVAVFAAFAYRSYLQKKKVNIEITKQKQVIEEKQKEILDSIHYAKRIQTALMPNEKSIHKQISNLTGKT